MIEFSARPKLCFLVPAVTLAIIFFGQHTPVAYAASIAIDSSCSLADAITAANTDRASGGCPAGNGADTVTIHEHITLSAALPDISSLIRIEGNSYSISGDGKYRIFRISVAGSLEVWNLTLMSGSAERGGAVYLAGGTLAIMQSVLADNSAGDEPEHHGGAIYMDGGVATIRFSNLSDNSAQSGGAVFLKAGSLTIQNSTLDKNSAANAGGAFANFGGFATLTHVTMVRNSALKGRSIYADASLGTLNLYNSLIFDFGPSSSCYGTLNGNIGNFIKDESCDSAMFSNPMLGERTGSPAYYPLREDSRAIDTAHPSYCLNVDQLGTSRPIPEGGRCDVGAIEQLPHALLEGPLPPPNPCWLADLIRSANTDTAVGGCPPGDGADTIRLTRDIVLLEALPRITSEITIEGAGHTINGDRRYRIFDVAARGKLTVNGLTLTKGNRTNEGNGGGIRVRRGGELTVNESIFDENSAIYGGAIKSDGKVTINRSVFIKNCCNWGGAISSTGDLTIDNSSFVRNMVGYWAAAIHSQSGNLVIRNSTFSYNEAWGNGGAIWIDGGTATITHVTMMYDKAKRGDGIYKTGGSLKLRNTVIYGGSKGEDCLAWTDENVGNLVGDGTCESSVSGIPLLKALSGSPPHHIPFNGSPVIDAAHSYVCLETDQRGIPRPNSPGDPCDIGAVESTKPAAVDKPETKRLGG